jgi:hypothetical protein
MVTKVFSEVYYDYCDPLLDEAAKQHHKDFILLTGYWCHGKKTIWGDSPENASRGFAVFKGHINKKQ